MENKNIPQSAQIQMPVNYFWSTVDPALPFTGSAYGNPSAFPPPNATRVPIASSYPKGTHPCWDYEKEVWVPRADYRQVRLYNKETGVEEVSSTIDCPEHLTDVPPNTQYDRWDEVTEQWITDEAKLNAEAIAERTRKRASEVVIATDQIDQLNDIVEYLETSDDGYEMYFGLLKEWRAYRTKLNILKINDLNAQFPVHPKLLWE